MTRRFEDWVDVEGLAPDERERLERVHRLLLAAGPPVDLPAGLERPPAQVIPLPFRRRRSTGVALVAAAALVAASLAGGYALGHAGKGGMTVVHTASLQSAGGGSAFASLEVGKRYESGNWPIEMTVSGLKTLTNDRAYYLLLLWHNGKPAGVCGAFRVVDGKTKVHFDVPYAINDSTHWVVTEIQPGTRYPGNVVMRMPSRA
jgi:hypothetical protein